MRHFLENLNECLSKSSEFISFDPFAFALVIVAEALVHVCQEQEPCAQMEQQTNRLHVVIETENQKGGRNCVFIDDLPQNLWTFHVFPVILHKSLKLNKHWVYISALFSCLSYPIIIIISYVWDRLTKRYYFGIRTRLSRSLYHPRSKVKLWQIPPNSDMFVNTLYICVYRSCNS